MNTPGSDIHVDAAAVSPEVPARRKVDLEEDSTSEIYDKVQLRVMVMKYAPSYAKWKCVGGPRSYKGKERAYYRRKSDHNLRMVVDLNTGEKRYYFLNQQKSQLRKAVPVLKNAFGQFAAKTCAPAVLVPIEGVSGSPSALPWVREWVFPASPSAQT